MAEFKRGIRKKGMIEALAELATRPGWWRDVLHDKSLVIGVRDDYLNVYWRGQSIFKVEMKHERIVATTHPKYLLDPDLSGQVALDPETDAFALDGLDALTRTYVPGETLPKLKRAAGLFAGPEKEGVQAIVNGNSNVVDVEIAFPAASGSRSVPRIDIAAFKPTDGGVQLVFWEAKVLSNAELRTTGEKNVVTQIKGYVEVLAEHAPGILDSYQVIAENLLAFEAMSDQARTVSSEIRQVAEKKASLLLPNPADVRLVVYGYDALQRDNIWEPLKAKLEDALGKGAILCRGEPDGIKL